MAVVVGRVKSGIIPARAGFTCGTRPRPWKPWDHPRSRGVYKLMRNMGLMLLGSSPLARGLQECPRRSVRTPGIIPARAGFTPRSTHFSAKNRDHPRSRGVYGQLRLRTAGLGGIIPARAGFTGPVLSLSLVMTDHPRSRGVYPQYPRGLRHYGGSSPLARGLRVIPGKHDTSARIIPARAGFTWNSRRRRRHKQDHPRSRGVYGHDVQSMI